MVGILLIYTDVAKSAVISFAYLILMLIAPSIYYFNNTDC